MNLAPAKNWLIKQHRNGWFIQPVLKSHGMKGGTSLDSLGELTELGTSFRRAKTIFVALGSASCLCASIEVARNSKKKSWDFILEENLPISAEEFVAQYVSSKQNRAKRIRELGCAVNSDLLTEVTDQLKSAKIARFKIVPDASILVQTAFRKTKRNGIYIAENTTHFDVVEIRDQIPVDWISLSKSHFKLDQLLLTAREMNSPVVLIASDYSERVSQNDSDNIDRVFDPDDLWCSAFNHQPHHWFEFAHKFIPWQTRHEKIRIAGIWLLISLNILIASFSFSLLWNAKSMNKLVQRLQNKQASIFVQAFPEEKVPVGILNRLKSEQRKLSGLSGMNSDAPSLDSSLSHFAKILKGLPDGLRYRIVEVRIGENQIKLDGEARSHGDADRIAKSMRQIGFVVDSPKTQQLESGGVSFQVNLTSIEDRQS